MIQKIFKYLKYFCSGFYGYVGKWLDQKAKVNFNIYNVTNWEIIAIPILPNISRSKDNHTIRLGRLIECKTRIIFLEKSYAKCGGKTSPRPFTEKSKLSISVNQQSKRV